LGDDVDAFNEKMDVHMPWYVDDITGTVIINEIDILIYNNRCIWSIEIDIIFVQGTWIFLLLLALLDNNMWFINTKVLFVCFQLCG
jgi:hypothetical protein